MYFMLTRYFVVFISLFSLTASFSILAEEEVFEESAPPSIYFTLEPDIITNFYTPGSRSGYIRIRVDLVVNAVEDIHLLEYHLPLIRNTISEVLSAQPEKVITSLTARETLRQELLQQVNSALMPEVSKETISNLLFTKYLYDI